VHVLTMREEAGGAENNREAHVEEDSPLVASSMRRHWIRDERGARQMEKTEKTARSTAQRSRMHRECTLNASRVYTRA